MSSTPVPRTRWIVPVLVGLALLIVAGVWWFAAGPGSSAEPAPTAQATDEADDADASDAGEQVAQALELLETDPAALLPQSLVEEFGADMASAVPAGTDVEADPSTWQPSETEGGVIQAVLRYPDGTIELLAIVVVQEDGAWKVLQTIPLEGQR